MIDATEAIVETVAIAIGTATVATEVEADDAPAHQTIATDPAARRVT